LDADAKFVTFRDSLAEFFSHLPSFRGKGRIVLGFDRCITNYYDSRSYLATGTVNGDSRLLLDLRLYGQKFAFYYRELEGSLIAQARHWYRPGIFIDVGGSIGLGQ
jgi:hypothetical protein